ncbi:MAG TPA: DMT family transporter [Acetobacteraceae bacterium]|nr:DMT family transporter [Acetobacteraceae bacterium]
MQRHDHLDTRAIAVVVLLCALWGVQQVTVKVALHDGFPPLLQAAVRSAGAAILCAAWIGGREGANGLRASLGGLAAARVGLATAALFGAEFTAIYLGLRLTSASRAVLFLYTSPFFTALGAHLLLPRERLRAAQVAGLAVAFAGLLVAFSEGLRHGQGSIAGDALCTLGGALWAMLTLTMKASPSLRRARASGMLLYQLAGSAPLLLGGAAALGELAHPLHADALAWACVLYQTVIVAFASYLAWFWLVVRYPVGKLSGFTFLTPLFGILAGGLLLGETLSVGLFVGVAAICTGLQLLNRRVPALAL